MIKENEILMKVLSDVYSEKIDKQLSILSDDGYTFSEKYNRKII